MTDRYGMVCNVCLPVCSNLMWPLFALGSALAFCFVSVCDKRLLSFHLNGVPPLCLWCGTTGLIYGTIVAAIVGIPPGTTWQVAITPIVSGLFMGCSVVLLFRGLRLMEASRAVAISQTNPIFVAILALVFLQEHISIAQWFGIAMVVAGAALISIRLFQETPFGRVGAGLAVPTTAIFDLRVRGALYGPAILFVSAFCAASSFVVAKAALNAHLPVLTVFGIQQATVGVVFLCVGLTGGPRLWTAVKQPGVLAMLLFGESLMPAISILLGVYAYSLGPASLVAAVLATRPLFVFIASTILSRMRWQFLDESLNPRVLSVKAASIVMIVGGVAALSMG